MQRPQSPYLADLGNRPLQTSRVLARQQPQRVCLEEAHIHHLKSCEEQCGQMLVQTAGRPHC